MKRPEKNCYQACPIGSLENFHANAGVWRFRITFTVNVILKHVAKLSLYLSFNVYFYYSKIKTFMPRLSVRIIFSVISLHFLTLVIVILKPDVSTLPLT